MTGIPIVNVNNNCSSTETALRCAPRRAVHPRRLRRPCVALGSEDAAGIAGGGAEDQSPRCAVTSRQFKPIDELAFPVAP